MARDSGGIFSDNNWGQLMPLGARQWCISRMDEKAFSALFFIRNTF